jgi:hypothetical protein
MEYDQTTSMLLSYDPIGLVAGGPRIKVYITAPGGVPGRDSSVETWALIDTGATGSAISKTPARHLDLAPVEKTTITTAKEVFTSDVFDVHIFFKGTKVAFGPWKVCEMEDRENGLILGRDFLNHVVLVYDGQGLIFVSILSDADKTFPHKSRLRSVFDSLANGLDHPVMMRDQEIQ